MLPVRPERGGSSSSSSDESPVDAVAEVPHAAEDHEAARRRISAALRPELERCRRVVRFYTRNGDAWAQLERDAAEAGLPLRAFSSETVTRWNSTYEMLLSEQLNQRALAVSAAKREAGPLVELATAAGRKLLLHACYALQPLRAATKLLEGDGAKARGSLYLPAFSRAREALAAQGDLPTPSELREAHPGTLPAAQLCPLARDLRAWLAADLALVQKKHLEGTNGLRLLQAASYLDPRFKDAPRAAGDGGPSWATPADLARARATVKELAVRAAEQFPALVERWREARAHPDNAPLAALAPAAKRPRRGRRVVADEPPAPAGDAGAVVAVAAAAAPPRPRVLVARDSADDLMFGRPGRAAPNPAPAVAALDAEIESQLTRFLALPAEENLSTDPLVWWRARAWQMPHVAAAAMQVFSLPASTAALERLFSAAARAVNKSRPRLAAKSAAGIIYGHANVRRGVQGARAQAPQP